MGGGILSINSLNAVELSTIKDCNNENQTCKIGAEYSNQSITNNTSISTERISIETQLKEFINEKNGTITFKAGSSVFVLWNDNGGITTFTNYGTMQGIMHGSGYITGGIDIYKGKGITTINNYGTMGGVITLTGTTTINNLGFMDVAANTTGIHISIGQNSDFAKVLLQNYKIKVDESASNFNSFISAADGKASDASKNSHLVVEIMGKNAHIAFKDGSSKIILGFGNAFQLGEAYLIEKLVLDKDGGKVTGLDVDFSRLVLSDEYKDLYTLIKSGDDAFIVNLIGGGGGGGSGGGNSIVLHTPITAIYKANIRTMNNFMILSNSMIYPRKYSKSQNLGKSSLRDLPTANRGNPLALSSLRADSQNLRGNPPYENIVDSAFSLKSYESFAYQNESQNLQTRRIQRQTKRNYSRNLSNSSLRADSQNLRGNPKDLRAKRSNHPQNQKFSQNLAQSDKYYFILTPFVNYNNFAKSGNYNLSGFDGGFLTAFSAKVAESNSLGAHFAFSYGSLNDKHDKDLSIKSMNFMLGLNYKLDLVWDMFLKARGDVFYFANALDSATLKNIKPNNLGFGASVLFGKDFDFKQGGILGLEAGLDYKALKSNKISIDSQEYQQALYNLIYADVGVNYAKYFGGFGINLGGGFKANLAPNLAKSILLAHSQNLDFVLDNDKYLGYANVGVSYVLNTRNFDMEFSLAYYGNFGDRVISNGGGFEWRTTW